MEQTDKQTRTVPLYVALAKVLAWNPPAGSQWIEKRQERINALRDMLPHGSGIDTDLVVNGNDTKIAISFSFHHMNDGGYYDGWTDHTVSVIPNLAYGFDMRISGRDRNEIKDYIAQSFDYALRQTVEDT